MPTYNPFSRGRWYRFFIESDGSDIKITSADLEASNSNSYLQMPSDFHIMDCMYDVHTIEGGAATNMDLVLRTYADGKQAVALPPVGNFDYASIYIFGYFDN